MRVPSPRPASPLHRVHDPHPVHARGRNRTHVRRPARLRSAQLSRQAAHQGRTPAQDPRQGVRHAQLARAVRGILERLARSVPPGAAQTAPATATEWQRKLGLCEPLAEQSVVNAGKSRPISSRGCRGRRHRMEQDILELPYAQTGHRRERGRRPHCPGVVRCHRGGTTDGVVGVGAGVADCQAAAGTGFDCERGRVSGRVGEVGAEEQGQDGLSNLRSLAHWRDRSDTPDKTVRLQVFT